MPRTAGHVEGARRAAEAVEACRALGVEVRCPPHVRVSAHRDISAMHSGGVLYARQW